MNYFHEVRRFKLKCATECQHPFFFLKDDPECQRKCVERHIEALICADDIRRKDLPKHELGRYPSDR